MYEVTYAYLQRDEVPPLATLTLPSVLTFARLFNITPPEEGLETHGILNEDLLPLANHAIELIEWH